MTKLIAAAFALLVLIAHPAMAQSKASAASADKVKALFADKAFTDAACEMLVKDGAPVFDCTYRGKGLQTVSTRGLMVREDALDADVVMVMSNAGALELFPKTTEFFRKLVAFNGDADFCKVWITDSNSITISSLLRVSQINTPADLKFQFDQVAACASEFVTQFEADKK